MLINYHILYLSIVQSLTEFLPVSSSGHLILFPKLFGFKDLGLEVDVALHFGSVLAVVIYFSKIITQIIKDLLKSKFLYSSKYYGTKVFYLMIVATIPVVIAGLSLHFYGQEMFRSQKLIGWTLIGFGFLLGFADKACLTIKRIEHLKFLDAFIIGCGQCLALIPGTSRSGSCITFCRFIGMERREAAKFSMLLSIPAIIGASGLVFFEVLQNGGSFTVNMLDAVVYTFIGSLLVIYIMMKWLKKSTFMPFVLYRIVLGCYLLCDSYGVF
ncbi:MAG: undecaprenyl-diphosphate phosphatase [Alphaproteobacteria bacterium]